MTAHGPTVSLLFDTEDVLAAEFLERCCEITMEKWYRMRKGFGLTEAVSKEEFYGFRASDIVDFHTHMIGFGDSVFFRLRDGRVFDTLAREYNPDPTLYDQTVH